VDAKRTDAPRPIHRRPEITAELLNEKSIGHLPGLLGIEILEVSDRVLRSRLTVRPDLLAPNGFLHAATVIALADTTAGYGTVAHLPKGASGFTTIELKTNFLGTVLDGAIDCEATAAHLGRTTQVWDAVVSAAGSGKTLALFRCSQMILWPDSATVPAKSA
jgi:1,4-dihydroxy-2-naphthoyl-CoA hydrolase